MHRATRRRPSIRALALLVSCVAAAGCASDGPTRPELPDRPTVERPEGAVPEGVTEMREALADRRSESRDLMDTTLVHPTTLETHEPAGPGVFGFLNRVGNLALDVVSLRTFGLW
ncbi:MAG: hypothetical protein K8T90_10205 [Planctomycetes bacterium]|nr:hypothetical protein [Planctomycetota bacterium]